MNARPTLALAALTLLGSSALADVIHRTDGTSIEDVTVVEENMNEVTYKRGSGTLTLPSDKVLSIDYKRKPRLLEEADALLSEDDISGALDILDGYVEGQIERPNERRKWAPPYAAWRTVELRMSLADVEGARSAAVRLINNYGDARYVPQAYLAKASAEIVLGRHSDAARTLQGMEKLVQTKELSRRWELECRLGQIEADVKKDGDARRTDLGIVIREAGSEYPTVKSRAEILEGETFLDEADKTVDPKKAAELRGKARRVFERLLKEPGASNAALAGIHTGLGECLFYAGAESDDQALLKEAAMHYLRVITLFREESRYVSKALYFAMRCFHLTRDRGRKNDMYRELSSLYPNSSWVAEAEKIRR